MKTLALILALAAVPAFAQDDPDAYTELVKRVQIALHLTGFDPGPINGLNEGRAQAALAQFQLSRNLPASGALDDQTLAELGVSKGTPPEEEESASAGAGMPLARP
jgi:peptidoglycan hydrolase-like protein with peptidoglycan-binding domain